MSNARRSLQRAVASFRIDQLEPRRLLCGLSHDALAKAPAFDWAIEAAESARLRELSRSSESNRSGDAGRLNESGGAEAVSIVWSNRGQASDGFAAAFGTLAERARGVVDAVFLQWSRIITSFNRSDGTSTLQVSVNMTPAAGFSAAAGPSTTAPSDGKPRTGSITLNRGNNTPNADDDNGWFLDATPMDNAEFLGNMAHAFNARATNTAQGSDFFSVVNLELAHVLGFISDRSNTGGSYQGYLLENFVTNTGIADNVGGGGNGRLYTFNGPNIQHLMTSFNSGDNNLVSWGNVIHTAEAGSAVISGNTWNAVDDEGDAWFNGAERVLPSFVTAQILADAYGYSIVHPATFATTHVVLNQSTGLLTVRGGQSATSSDVIVIDADVNDFIITVDVGDDVAGSGALRGAGNLPAYVTRVPIASVGSITVQGRGGTDFIRIERNAGRFVNVDAGDGNDFIDFGFGIRNLSTITVNVSVAGGAGNDAVFVYDNNNPSASTYSITSARFDRPGWGGFSYAGDIEGLTLFAGAGTDTVNVTSTFNNQPIFINNAGGADTVNIGNTGNGLQSIIAGVQVQNDPSFTTLNITNTADASNRVWDIDINGGFGFLRGMSPGVISWDNADINDINLLTGSGIDTGVVARLTETLRIDNRSGSNRDSITFGASYAQGMSGLFAGRAGGITVDNTTSYTDFFFNDTGSAVGRAINLTEAGNRNTLTGMSPVAIDFDGFDTRSINLITGGGADVVNVSRLRTGGIVDASVSVSSSGDRDTVNLGNPTDGLQGIATPNTVTVTNPPSFTTLNLNNSNDAVSRNMVIGYDAVTNLQSLTGASGSGARFLWRPNDIDFLGGVSFFDGSAASNITILDNRRRFNLQARGPDSIRFGDATTRPQLQEDVFLTNPPSFSSIMVDASADVAAHTFRFGNTLIGTDPYGTIGGVDAGGFGTIYYKLADTSSVTVSGSSGADRFDVISSQARPIMLRGLAGSDVFQLGSSAVGQRNTNGITGPLTIDAGAGDFDTIIAADQDNAAGTVTTVNPGNIRLTNNLQVNITEFELVGVHPSDLGGTIDVINTSPMFSVDAYSGPGTDNINVYETAPGAAVNVHATTDGSSGYDLLDVDVNNTALSAWARVIDGFYGSISARNQGLVSLNNSFAIRTQGISFAGSGRLDVGNAAIIYEYGGVSPISEVATLIAGGYIVNPAAPENRAIGYVEATDILTLPDTWRGGDVVGPAVLIASTLKGDSDLNGNVNFLDLLSLARNYGSTTGMTWFTADFDADGDVDFNDLLVLVRNYGQSMAWASISPPTTLFSPATIVRTPAASVALTTLKAGDEESPVRSSRKTTII